MLKLDNAHCSESAALIVPNSDENKNSSTNEKRSGGNFFMGNFKDPSLRQNFPNTNYYPNHRQRNNHLNNSSVSLNRYKNPRHYSRYGNQNYSHNVSSSVKNKNVCIHGNSEKAAYDDNIKSKDNIGSNNSSNEVTEKTCETNVGGRNLHNIIDEEKLFTEVSNKVTSCVTDVSNDSSGWNNTNTTGWGSSNSTGWGSKNAPKRPDSNSHVVELKKS